MRMTVSGVGQTLNFSSGMMEDVLHLEDALGNQVSVAISNVDAQKLVALALSGKSHVRQEDARDLLPDEKAHMEEYDGGSAVFGGDVEPEFSGEEQPKQVMSFDDMVPEPAKRAASIADKAYAKVGDRSGVPSKSLPSVAVDEMGNPLLPSMPSDYGMDDDEDPGEQI